MHVMHYIRVIGGLVHEMCERRESTIEQEFYITQLTQVESQGGEEHSMGLQLCKSISLQQVIL